MQGCDLAAASVVAEEAARSKHYDEEKAICVVLFDIKKAYSSVSWKMWWQPMKRAGLNESIVNLVSSLHQQTRCLIRTQEGDSEVWSQRGVAGVAAGTGTEGPESRRTHMKSCSEFLPECVHAVLEGEELQHLDISTVCFADDTTILSRWEHSKEIEKTVPETEQRYGEAVHLGKTERMRIQPWNVPPPEGAEKSVRVLGRWIDCDGGARTDSQKRKQAAGTLWSKLRPQLPRLYLTSNSLGRVIEACIISSLFFAAEVRTFTQVD